MNKRDLDILNILFQSSSSSSEMTATEICNAQRDLTQSTVIAVLRKLLKDNMVEVAGVTHSGKVISRTYRPTAEAKKLVIEYFIQELDNVKNIFSIDELLEAKNNSEKITTS